jgi:hypothetical protein
MALLPRLSIVFHSGIQGRRRELSCGNIGYNPFAYPVFPILAADGFLTGICAAFATLHR